MSNAWRDSWQWFRRDLRQGELTLLLLALVLAVAATTSLRFFSGGVETRLQREAARLLAADLVVRSSRPLSAEFTRVAQDAGLRHADSLEFSSVLLHGDEFQLASVKAVSAGYPLRGELRLREGEGERGVRTIPGPGEIWLDSRLFTLLKLTPGSPLQLGEVTLRATAVLAYEPGQGGFSGFSPRALMNLQDVAAAGVVQPGSRLHYQLMLAGEAAAVAAYRARMEPRLDVGMRLLDVREGRPEVGTPLARSQSYFSLATIVAVVLAGLAIVTCSRRFAERHYDQLALLRCLGASRRESLARLLGELAWVWLAAVVLGALLGVLAAQVLNTLLQGLLPGGPLLPTLGRPLLTGILTATLTLLGFALPSLVTLGSVSPLHVLRRDMPSRTWSRWAATSCALVALLVLLTLETGQAGLAFIVIAGGGAAALLLWWALARALAWLRRRVARPGLAAVLRDPRESSLQILGLGIGLTALLLVTSLRGELLSAWQGKIPVDAPNQFALNITPEERAPLTAFLRERGVTTLADPYAVVRGRLAAINNRPVQQAVSKEREGERDESLNRELNLTWRATLPTGNELVAGMWWRDQAEPSPRGPLNSSAAAPIPDANANANANDDAPARTQGAMSVPVSVEQKLAERLGLRLGDRLRFSMAEGDLEARVTSLRTVQWDSFQPNFYFIFPPGSLDSFPASYLTSFHLPPAQRGVLAELVQAFPTVILIDVASMMGEVRRLLDQVARAVEAVLAFILAGGLLVITAQVLASLDARRYEAALLRVTGISRRDLQLRLAAEFLSTGALAGLLAALLNELLAAAVHHFVLDLPPVLHPALWWQAPLAGALLVLAAGLPGARAAWRASPLLVLRQG
ncbi:MAG: FtsX-like permease family protein [Pseudomonadota bacterium]